MVPEDELSVVTQSLVNRADNPSKVLHLFPEIVQFAHGVTSSNRAGTKVSHDS
jgi:hypothetical protein